MYHREMGGSSNKNPMPEASKSFGGMRPSDRGRTSDGSGSESGKMVDAMHKMIDMIQNLESKLEQADQKVLDLTKERDNLTNRLEQANRKNEELANQLKQARSGETPSTQRGESSSHPTKSRDQESKEIQEWFEKRLNDARTQHEERERAKHKKSWWK